MMEGTKVKNRKKAKRIVRTIDWMGKPGFVQLLMDIGAAETKKEARCAYDLVTTGLNAWLRAKSRNLPKGTWCKLILLNAFSVNLCWIRGSPWPDYVKLFVITSGETRANIRRLRLREYSHWKSQQPSHPVVEPNTAEYDQAHEPGPGRTACSHP